MAQHSAVDREGVRLQLSFIYQAGRRGGLRRCEVYGGVPAANEIGDVAQAVLQEVLVEQVNAAVKRRLKPDALVKISAGDKKKM